MGVTPNGNPSSDRFRYKITDINVLILEIYWKFERSFPGLIVTEPFQGRLNCEASPCQESLARNMG